MILKSHCEKYKEKYSHNCYKQSCSVRFSHLVRKNSHNCEILRKLLCEIYSHIARYKITIARNLHHCKKVTLWDIVLELWEIQRVEI